MTKAALLIDWDNFRTSLNQQQYHCYESADVVRRLRDAVEQVAADRGGHGVGPTRLYAPPEAIDGALRTRFVDLNVDVVDTTTNKQAADAAMMADAYDLLHSGIRQFFCVTGDVDFVPVARNLESREAECYLLPVSNRRINRATAGWHRCLYVEKLLELEECEAVGVDKLWLLILGCHLLIDRDLKNLVGYHKSIEGLTDLGILGGKPNVIVVWDEASNRGYFRDDYVGDRKRRRLAYERREVEQVVGLADVVLAGLRRTRGPQPIRGDLVPPMEHPLISGKPGLQSAIVEALLRVGYLHESDGRVTRAFPSAPFGLVEPVLDVVATAEVEIARRGWRSVPRSVIARQWCRHVVPSGKVRDPHATLEQGHDMVTRAEATGALYSRRVEIDGRRLRSFFSRADHPLVRRVEDVHAHLAQLLASHSSRRVPTDVVVDGLLDHPSKAAGSTLLEARRWLARFAGARAINWYEDRIEYRNDCRPLRWWSGEK